ncbi:pentapeptide repeat-containing protein [Streptomyces goshikiensis]
MTDGARIEDADMVKASLHGVDASGASFRGTRIKGASLFRVDLRGADLPPPHVGLCRHHCLSRRGPGGPAIRLVPADGWRRSTPREGP